jgi:hypothetical protein
MLTCPFYKFICIEKLAFFFNTVRLDDIFDHTGSTIGSYVLRRSTFGRTSCVHEMLALPGSIRPPVVKLTKPASQ